MSKLNFYFVRHGEHNIISDLVDTLNPISKEGVVEIEKIRDSLGLSLINSYGFCADSLRSIQTLSILLGKPTYLKRNIDKITTEMIEKGIIRKTELLQYKTITKKYFKEKLYEALGKNKALRFYVEDADKIADEDAFFHSTYQTVSKEIIDLFLKNIQDFKRKHQTFSNSKNQIKNIIFCIRRYMYACLRCKIIEINYGKEALSKYVDWYEKNIESKKYTEKLIGTLIWNDSNKDFILTDDYGKIIISYQKLLKFSNHDDSRRS